MVFKNRREAGTRLAKHLLSYQNMENLLVVGIPRKGVPVAEEVALTLKAPLEVFITRKIMVPGDPELVAGTVTEKNEVFWDQRKVKNFAIHALSRQREIAEKKAEMLELQRIYRGNRLRLNFQDRSVILVDDGVSSGATMKATVKSIRKEDPKRVVLAIPVIPLQLMDDLDKIADELVVLTKPFPFYTISALYQEWEKIPERRVSVSTSTQLVRTERG